MSVKSSISADRQLAVTGEPALGVPAPPQAVRSARRRRLYLAFAILASVLVYLNSLGNQFVFDDNLQIARNPQIRDLRNAGKAFSQPVWSFMAPQGKVYSNYYRPLHVLTYMLVYQVGELRPAGYHVASILFHALTTAMVYLAILRLAGLPQLALMVSLLFAVHPIHTESVTWIAGIPDVQCALFYLLAFYFWVRWRGAPASAERGWLLGACAAFFLALLAKEMALTLPGVLLVYERLFGEKEEPSARRGGRRLAQGFAYLGMVLLSYVGLRLWALGGFAPISNGHELTAREYFFSALALVGQYFQKAFLPVRLNAYHVFSPSHSLSVPVVLLGAVISLLILGILVFARKWPAPLRLPFFGAVWTVVTVVPVLAIRQVGYNVFAERYFYLPSVGACLLVGVLLWELYSMRPFAVRTIGVGVGLLVLTLFAVQTARRNRDWEDELTLYQQTLKVSPDATLIHNALGRVFFQRREFQKALAAHEAALAAEQHNYRQDPLLLADAYAGMGSVYLTLGQAEKAEESLHKALEYFPHHDAFLNLGVIAFQYKDYENAYKLSVRALHAFPVYDLAYNNAGATLLAMGKAREAIPYLEQAVQLSPSYTQAQINLAVAYQQTQQVQKAIQQLRAVVEREPNNQSALHFLRSLLEPAGPAPGRPP